MLSVQGDPKNASAMLPVTPKCFVVLLLVFDVQLFFFFFSLRHSLENKWFIACNNERGSEI